MPGASWPAKNQEKHKVDATKNNNWSGFWDFCQWATNWSSIAEVKLVVCACWCGSFLLLIVHIATSAWRSGRAGWGTPNQYVYYVLLTGIFNCLWGELFAVPSELQSNTMISQSVERVCKQGTQHRTYEIIRVLICRSSVSTLLGLAQSSSEDLDPAQL